MFANPIIRRYRFSQFRPQQVWVFGALYICLVLLVLLVNSSVYRYAYGSYKTLTELYRGLFVQFAGLEIFLLWLLCPVNCSNVVSREIADKSFDFFRMLPLSAPKKAVGLLLGRNLFCLAIAAINLVFCLVCGLASGFSINLMGQLVALLIALTLMLNLAALLFSLFTHKKAKSMSIPVLLVISFFLLNPIIFLINEIVEETGVEYKTISFFVFEIPALYLVAGCALFIACWMYLGVLRRFTYEYEALFSRIGAILFALTYSLVVLGLFFPYLYDIADNSREMLLTSTVRFFWVITLLPVYLVPFFVLRGFDRFLEISRKAYLAGGLTARLLASSNVLTGLFLYAIWLLFAVGAAFTTDVNRIAVLWLAMLIFSFYLVMLAMLETYAMWKPKNEKIGYLLGFLGILYCVLPFILGSVFTNRLIYLFSPFGIGEIFGEIDIWTLLAPIFFNLLCLLPLTLMIAKRYNDLLTIRMKIVDSARQQVV